MSSLAPDDLLVKQDWNLPVVINSRLRQGFPAKRNNVNANLNFEWSTAT